MPLVIPFNVIIHDFVKRIRNVGWLSSFLGLIFGHFFILIKPIIFLSSMSSILS